MTTTPTRIRSSLPVARPQTPPQRHRRRRRAPLPLASSVRLLLLLPLLDFKRSCVHALPSYYTASTHTDRVCPTVRHVHLSVGHDPSTSMTVSFSSNRFSWCGDWRSGIDDDTNNGKKGAGKDEEEDGWDPERNKPLSLAQPEIDHMSHMIHKMNAEKRKKEQEEAAARKKKEQEGKKKEQEEAAAQKKKKQQQEKAAASEGGNGKNKAGGNSNNNKNKNKNGDQKPKKPHETNDGETGGGDDGAAREGKGGGKEEGNDDGDDGARRRTKGARFLDDLHSNDKDDGSNTSILGAVLLGTSPTALDRIVIETPSSSTSSSSGSAGSSWYNATLPMHRETIPRGVYESDYFHHVAVEDLEPDTRYYYKCVVVKVPSKSGGGAEGADVGGHENMEVIAEVEDEEAFGEQLDGDDSEGDARRRKRRRRLRSRTMVGVPQAGAQEQQRVRSFVTAPAPGKYPSPATRNDLAGGDKKAVVNEARQKSEDEKSSSSLKIAVLGDVGARPHSKETIRHLASSIQNVSLLLLAGDIAYANAMHGVWDDFFAMLESHPNLVDAIPLQVAVGNHDVEADSVTGEFLVAYDKRFRMPGLRELSTTPLTKEDIDHGPGGIPYPLPYDYGNAYYSFVYGPSHHFVLSSYSSLEPGSIQYDWFVDQLENNVDRTVTPWLFVTLHCPLYNTFAWHRDDVQSTRAQEVLEPLFVQHRVNIVFSGHLHAYMRTKPVVNHQPDPHGPIHAIVGNGGRNANTPYQNPEPESWVHVRDHSMYGYGTLEIYNETVAKWEWIKTGHNAPDEGGKYRFEPRGDLHDEGYVYNQYFLD